MEEKETNRERSLSRAWEGQRLQEQFLALAYEQLWPVLRARLQQSARVQRRFGAEVELQVANGG